MSSSERSRRLRLVALVAVVLVLAAVGFWLDHTGRVDAHALVARVGTLGLWAVPAFFLLCVVGELLHLPGMLFVVVAQLAFGPRLGVLVAYAGAVLGVAVAFGVARAARGRVASGAAPPRRLRWAWANRLLERLDRRPVSTVLILRSVFWISPPLNYVLGWTRVRWRDYLLGSALGLVVPILVVSVVASWL